MTGPAFIRLIGVGTLATFVSLPAAAQSDDGIAWKPLPVPDSRAECSDADLIELVPLSVYAGSPSR